MRISVPSPLGGQLTLNTDSLPSPRRAVTSAPAMRRTQLRIVLLTIFIVCLMSFHPSPPLPPSYAAERRLEKYLSQHDRSLPFPEGKNGRFVKFDTPRETGFNHLLQRILLQHHVAVLGNTSFVFEPFVEDETWLPFQINRWPWRSARIPLTALVGNVVNGFETYYDTPRAVSDSYFFSVCPPFGQEVHIIKSEQNPEGTIELVDDGPGRIRQLQQLLLHAERNCVRIVGDVFDDRFFNSAAPRNLIDSLLESPVMKHFHFAPSVLALVNRLLPQIAPESSLYNVEDYVQASAVPHRNSHWKHILALHLRGGDGWDAACKEKGINADPFVAFNQLPLLPGNENVPPPPEMVEATRLGLYRAKCMPDHTAIIARARRMRKNHPLLRSIYILTDGPDEWVEETRRWLVSDAWEKVWVGKADIYPNWADREIGIAADMEVARRAGVFVGNGFSTTSSNIVLLRTRDGLHPDFTQFW